jgi:phage tail-like protein
MKQAEIKRLLPDIMGRTVRARTPACALLRVMEKLHAPSEAALEKLDSTFNPHRTPDRFVTMLARWVNLERLFEEDPGEAASPASSFLPTTGLGRLRELVSCAHRLWQWRGTKKGLLMVLETATGIAHFEIFENVSGAERKPTPFHLLVRAPKESEAHETLIRRIIALEKPASCTFELEFRTEEV